MEQRHWPRNHDELNEGPILVRIPTVEHLLNPMDPSPLAERALDEEVADWIEEWAEDLDDDQPLSVEIQVATAGDPERERAALTGLRSHFEYREWQADRRFKRLLREGRISLVIGLIALAGFNAASRIIGTSSNPVIEVTHEGLAVLGWVSMWRPLEMLLYDWWPIRKQRQAWRRLGQCDISFRRER
jgi:hypothetical protein